MAAFDIACRTRRWLRCSLFISCLAALAVQSSVGLAGPAPEKLPFASGRIRYQTSGMTKSTMVMCWTDNGRKFHQTISGTFTVNGQKHTMDSWSFFDGSSLFMFMPMAGKRVMRVKMPKGALGTQKAPPMPGGMPDPFGGMAQAGTRAGTGQVLGRTCEIRKIDPMKMKVWLWKGLVLRMEMQPPGAPMTSMVATKLETNPRLSPDLFRVPAGYTIQDFNPKTPMPGRPPTRKQMR